MAATTSSACTDIKKLVKSLKNQITTLIKQIGKSSPAQLPALTWMLHQRAMQVQSEALLLERCLAQGVTASIPKKCQPIQDEINQLEKRRNDLFNELKDPHLSPAMRVVIEQQIIAIGLALTQAQNQLKQCIGT